jgi:alkanesulfonate monooxygenase SsuD/methylene tetrahydromethanopterin reductase-like flavin-dependent oxidoreductase (luciferase family)
MKFGMFLIGDNSPDLNRNLKDYYDEIIEQVQLAEALGFECFWFGEHHFDFFGVIPSPPVMMSVAAKCTEKIRMGVAVSLLPFRNPIFLQKSLLWLMS